MRLCDRQNGLVSEGDYYSTVADRSLAAESRGDPELEADLEDLQSVFPTDCPADGP